MAALERDVSLFEADRLRERIDMIDRLEAYLVCGPDRNSETGPSMDSLYERVRDLSARLEAANQHVYESIRGRIRSGAEAGEVLGWAVAADPQERSPTPIDGERYDYLDAAFSGILQIEEPVSGIGELAAEMVFYQPTPARHIVDLLDRIALTEHDVLIDLGSGLGHVPLLAAIYTKARCIGIEREPAYVDCARRCASGLNLRNATFIQQDVRAADLSEGTVFYMYTPFTGGMMDTVLRMLHTEAAARKIRICTLGPCTPIVAREPWLESGDALTGDRPAVFRSI